MGWDDWKAPVRKVDFSIIEWTSTFHFPSLLLHVGALHCHGADTVSESGNGCIYRPLSLTIPSASYLLSVWQRHRLLPSTGRIPQRSVDWLC